MNWLKRNFLWCSFFLLLMIALIFPFQDGDIFFYLSLGRWIFEKGSLPAQDPFLYTVQNWWITHEWLSYVIFYVFYGAGSWYGLVLLKILLWSLAFGALIFFSRRWKIPEPLALAIFLLTALACSHRFIERASLFSDVIFTVISLYFLRSEKISRRALWCFPVVFIFWVNVHPGFVLGLGLFTLYVLFQRGPVSLWFSLAASDLACLVNPRLIDGFLYPLRTALSSDWELFKKFNYEWMPTFREPFLSTWEVHCLIALIVLTLVLMIVCWIRKPRQNLFPWAVLILNLYLAQMASRFMTTSALGFAALALFALRELDWKPREKSQFTLRIVCAMALLGGVGWIALNGYESASGPRTLGIGVDEKSFPVKAVEFIEIHHLQGRIFNQYDWGSYLVWSLNREQALFIHGHVDDPKLLAYGYHGMNGPKNFFDETVNKYGIQYFLLDRTKLRLNPPLPILQNLRSWPLIYQDDTSLIWQKP